MSGGELAWEAGYGLPHEKIVRLRLAASQPVTLCHEFKGGGKLPPPFPQMLDSVTGNSRSVRLEPRRRELE